ncbi:MAG: tRNA 2-thiouridine(34) synthase MnmA [Planctomycetota bacterium]
MIKYMITGKKIVVAMSGGVDSSVTAALLKEQGYEVTGLFMSLGTCLEKLAPRKRACCSTFDANDARQVAQKLGLDFLVIDFKAEFEKLIDYFCREYDAGRTPNPCIRCNQDLKFGRLLSYAQNMGAGYIATGHYARIEYNSHCNRYIIRKGKDEAKDQSYVLFSLTQEQLSRTVLPLGDYTKSQVRALAKKIDLPVQDKPDSQEICFVPDNNYGNIIRTRLPGRINEGEIRDAGGKLLGRHPGYQLFTIGQRHGLKIALGEPVYVTQVLPDTNTIIVGPKKELARWTMTVEEINWVSIEGIKPGESLMAEVKIRYAHRPVRATVRTVNTQSGVVKVEFERPELAITPGQAAVFYQGDVVLGGGWINK